MYWILFVSKTNTEQICFLFDSIIIIIIILLVL